MSDIVKDASIRHFGGVGLRLRRRLSRKEITCSCGLPGTTDLLNAVYDQEAQQLMVGAWHGLNSMQPSSPHEEIIWRWELDDQDSTSIVWEPARTGSEIFPNRYSGFALKPNKG